MAELKHWTAQSTDDFLYKIAADFALQLQNWIDASDDNRTSLAEKLGVSPARVSQVLNNPGNMTIRLIAEYALALGKKVAIVGYDDNDLGNAHGPINSQVFEQCWKRAGMPRDFGDIEEADAFQTFVIQPVVTADLRFDAAVAASAKNAGYVGFAASSSAGTEEIQIRAVVGATTNG